MVKTKQSESVELQTHTGTGGTGIFSIEQLSILVLLIRVCGEVASLLALRVVKMMHEPHWDRLVLYGEVW